MSQENKKQGAMVKILIVAALVILVGATIYAKNASKPDASDSTQKDAQVKTGEPVEKGEPSDATAEGLPKLVDLGAKKCVPCKMMAPILDELKEEYKGKFDVVFIDVWENEAAKDEYGIRMIPTQIFYDAEGEEKFRHEGFFSKEDILAKWKELGVTIGEKNL